MSKLNIQLNPNTLISIETKGPGYEERYAGSGRRHCGKFKQTYCGPGLKSKLEFDGPPPPELFLPSVVPAAFPAFSGLPTAIPAFSAAAVSPFGFGAGLGVGAGLGCGVGPLGAAAVASGFGLGPFGTGFGVNPFGFGGRLF